MQCLLVCLFFSVLVPHDYNYRIYTKNKSISSLSSTPKCVQVSEVHKDQCASLSVSEDGRYLLTAGYNTVKVWDYNMKLDVKSQVCVCV